MSASGFLRMPNGLLLEVTQYLGQSEIASLCLLSKRLNNLMQILLYHSVDLCGSSNDIDAPSDSDSNNNFRNLRFLRTILSRPDLTSSVRSIKLSANDRTAGPSLIPPRSARIPPAKTKIAGDAFYAVALSAWRRLKYDEGCGEWRGLLIRRDHPAHAGLILALLPSLVAIDIDVLTSGERGSNVMEGLFVSKVFTIGMPLPKIAAFGQLQTLAVRYESLNTLRFSFPDLTRLSIYGMSYLNPCPIMDLYLDVKNTHRLEMPSLRELHIEVLGLYHHRGPTQRQVFQNFLNFKIIIPSLSAILPEPGPKHLELDMKMRLGQSFGANVDEMRLDYHAYVELVCKAFPDIESLEIRANEDNEHFTAVTFTPFKGFQEFKNLRQLDLDLAALADKNSIGYELASVDVLPPTLETLRVHDLDESFIPFLKQLSSAKSTLKDLSIITAHNPMPHLEKTFYQDLYRMTYQLRKQGIELILKSGWNWDIKELYDLENECREAEASTSIVNVEQHNKIG